MPKVVQCPVCKYIGGPPNFRAFSVQLAKEAKPDGTLAGPLEKTPFSVCPKCGVAFRPG